MAGTRVYWLHTLSPTHVGVGRGLGYIDLPIDREAITGWPIIRGSAFKGVLADLHNATEEGRKVNPELKAAFGTSSDQENKSYAGALIPSDAKIVCLPVRSYRGTFAWATSPMGLSVLHRTLKLAGVDVSMLKVPAGLENEVAHCVKGSALKEGENIFLEDLNFRSKDCPTAMAWAQKIGEWVFKDEASTWLDIFIKRFVVLPDLAFDFLCQTGTEVHTRIRIDQHTKTVANGALWNEESLPAESILAGVIHCEKTYTSDPAITSDSLLKLFATEPTLLQMGGKASVGRGNVRCVFTEVK